MCIDSVHVARTWKTKTVCDAETLFLGHHFGDMLTYLCLPRPWANKIVVLAQKAKAFDFHFILNRAIMLKWKPKLIIDGLKILCMKTEEILF